MSLLVGTKAGVYRADAVPFDDAERTLDTGRANQLLEVNDGILAATTGGLYRSEDDGRSWADLGVPTERVWSVLAASDGTLYAGTQPAHLYVSEDRGTTWTERESLRDQPTVGKWRCAYGPDERVRTIAAHPDAPERLFAGIEAGGLYRSTDGGATWAKCELRDQTGVVQDDIHHAVPAGPDALTVACGRLSIHDLNHAAAEGGVYHTDDAGGSWHRLDFHLIPSYYRAVLRHDGALYLCGTTTVPPEWATLGAHSTLFVSTDGGHAFEEQAFPGGPEEVVLAWAADGDRVLGGTAVGERGRVIHRDGEGDWETAGFVPDDVHALYAG